MEWWNQHALLWVDIHVSQGRTTFWGAITLKSWLTILLVLGPWVHSTCSSLYIENRKSLWGIRKGKSKRWKESLELACMYVELVWVRCFLKAKYSDFLWDWSATVTLPMDCLLEPYSLRVFLGPYRPACTLCHLRVAKPMGWWFAWLVIPVWLCLLGEWGLPPRRQKPIQIRTQPLTLNSQTCRLTTESSLQVSGSMVCPGG